MTDAARRWLVLAAMLLGSTLATLSSGVLTVSVVPLMDEFRLDLRSIEWVLASYNVVFAALMIGSGAVATRAFANFCDWQGRCPDADNEK